MWRVLRPGTFVDVCLVELRYSPSLPLRGFDHGVSPHPYTLGSATGLYSVVVVVVEEDSVHRVSMSDEGPDRENPNRKQSSETPS